METLVTPFIEARSGYCRRFGERNNDCVGGVRYEF
jgi:hypothetical protein